MCTYGEPDAPCSSEAVQSVVIRVLCAHDKTRKRSLSCCNRTNATRFSVQRVNISCEGLVEKVSWWEETDRASLKHCNVEFRIAQDGAVLYLFLEKVKTPFFLSFATFTNKFSNFFGQKSFSDDVCKTKSWKGKSGSVGGFLDCHSRSSSTKRKPKKNPEGNAQETIKDWENVDCDQCTSKGQCSRGASFSFKHDSNKKKMRKEEDPALKRENNTRKETEKEKSKGKNQKYSPPGKTNKPVCCLFQKGQCQK